MFLLVLSSYVGVVANARTMCDRPAVGTQVEIQGLKSRPDLNGKRGWVTAYDADADRVEVSFGGPNCDKIKVKPPNAVPVAQTKSAADGLVVGAFVEIIGLQSRADLNGRRGSIVSRDDVAGRIEVQLAGLAAGERVKVKPGNAKIAKDGLAVGVQVEIVDFHSRAELNGRRGVVVARDAVPDIFGNEKVEVHLDGPNGGERIKCKPANCKLVSSQVDLGAAVEMAAAAARLKAKGRPQQDEGLAGYTGHLGAGEDATRATRDREPDRQATPVDRGNLPDTDRSRRDDRDRDRVREQDRKPDRSRSRPRSGLGPRSGPDRGHDPAFNVTLFSGTTEDRSNDWVCPCGERNFARRAECHRCHAPRSSNAPSFKDVSHSIAQERKSYQATRVPRPMGGPLGEWTSAKGLLGQSDWDSLRQRIDARKKRSSSSSSSSSSRHRERKKKNKKRSKSSSSSSEKDFDQVASSVKAESTELDKLKNGALQSLLKIKDEAPEVRKKSWRALLLEWHPDKHPEDPENATAVFQFLQKAKPLLDLKSAG